MAQILLIEGHRLMRDALKDLLEKRYQHSLDLASDPLEAIHLVIHRPPHVILLDTTWTETSGVFLSRVLREMAPQSYIVLLVDEAWPDDEEVKRTSGANAFVVKASAVDALPALLKGVQTTWVAA
jgi:DNA-binding NarL/FixJ family response regulator